MVKRFLVVRAASGRMIQHPESIGAHQRHFIGHNRVLSDTPTRHWTGEMVRAASYEIHENTERVPDPAPLDSQWFRRAIRDGDLEYVESVEETTDAAGAVTDTRTFKDAQLVAWTVQWKAARERQAKVDADHTKLLAERDAADLERAARGIGPNDPDPTKTAAAPAPTA